MAKKKEEAAAPAVSTIPLAEQDSPLVIDLPDGQKLVVGNIAHGTVIEVATWRGTGRPDSRTSRLMLGVSSSANVTAEGTSASSSAEQSPKNQKLSPVKKFLSSLIEKSPKRKQEKAVKEIDALFNDDEVSAPNKGEEKEASRVSKAFEDSNDIDSWLDDLMKGTSAPFDHEGTSSSSKVKRIKSVKGETKSARKSPSKPKSTRKPASTVRKAGQKRAKTSKRR